eukprot:14373620-Alexandrium_andersonii.AAC.1
MQAARFAEMIGKRRMQNNRGLPARPRLPTGGSGVRSRRQLEVLGTPLRGAAENPGAEARREGAGHCRKR